MTVPAHTPAADVVAPPWPALLTVRGEATALDIAAVVTALASTQRGDEPADGLTDWRRRRVAAMDARRGRSR